MARGIIGLKQQCVLVSVGGRFPLLLAKQSRSQIVESIRERGGQFRAAAITDYRVGGIARGVLHVA